MTSFGFDYLFATNFFQKRDVAMSVMVANGAHRSWVGARDHLNNDRFEFIGTNVNVSGTLWNSGHPDHLVGDCTVLDVLAGYLLTADCSDEYNFICEIMY